MSDVIDLNRVDDASNVPVLPGARLRGAGVEMRVRPGRLTDYEFVDALQKADSHGNGFLKEAAIKGHIRQGHMLIAEVAPAADAVNSEQSTVNRAAPVDSEQSTVNSGEGESPVHCSLNTVDSPAPPVRVGYILAVDRYLKRDELGVIYQMCVAPEYRRSLVAANLLKAQFERSAYGCRLYCCWCAQDLSASRFWEAMGFVPLAFRTGSRKTGWKDERGAKHTEPRVHIFWQKRIREGDTGDAAEGGTPFWFPSQTGGGAMAEDRLVLPIPLGTHWSDAKPVVLPSGPIAEGRDAAVKLLEDEVSRLEREKKQAVKAKQRKAVEQALSKHAIEMGGLRFAPGSIDSADGGSPENTEAKRAAKAEVEQALKDAKRAVKRAKQKFDPEQERFARELKDRWLEQVVAQPGLIAPSAEKYAVRRCIEATKPMESVGVEGVPGKVPGARRLDAA